MAAASGSAAPQAGAAIWLAANHPSMVAAAVPRAKPLLQITSMSSISSSYSAPLPVLRQPWFPRIPSSSHAPSVPAHGGGARITPVSIPSSPSVLAALAENNVSMVALARDSRTSGSNSPRQWHNPTATSPRGILKSPRNSSVDVPSGTSMVMLPRSPHHVDASSSGAHTGYAAGLRLCEDEDPSLWLKSMLLGEEEAGGHGRSPSGLPPALVMPDSPGRLSGMLSALSASGLRFGRDWQHVFILTGGQSKHLDLGL